MLTKAREHPHTAVLIGFESSGKSALFRGLTGEGHGGGVELSRFDDPVAPRASDRRAGSCRSSRPSGPG
ncbi:hypothetical protein [Paenibacillus konkukensis]|uniref:hypothetical protein n=1 Tax=Paenibacillus konkukensis TaxID=2020716 RepID=UPI00201DE791|nr:hypothetical protein [Paenibacillus konkukensis]